MKMLFSLLIIATISVAQNVKQIDFPSKDGLKITADIYLHSKKDAPFIILFHQARWSRGEYREIAPKLVKMGFSVMATDQRSGEAVNGVSNETYKRAVAAKKKTGFLDAYQDMEAAVDFVKKTYAPKNLIIWGSSYSSSLSLYYAGQNPDKIQGVMAFAPGDYFDRFGKPKGYVTNSAKNINMPVFITSAKREVPSWKPIFDVIPSKQKVAYTPKTEGNHGSRALWDKFDDSSGYWSAVRSFLFKFLADNKEMIR